VIQAIRKILPVFGRLPRSKRIGPIGLELAADKLHLVQMNFAGTKASLRAALSVPYPSDREALTGNPSAFRRFIKQSLAMAPFSGRQVVSCFPTNELKMLTINYRLADDGQEADQIMKALKERFAVELDQSIVDYMPIRHDTADLTERTALVALAPREGVLKHLNRLRAAGLTTLALDIGPSALGRVLSEAGGESNSNVLLINFGLARTYLTVRWGKRLMVDRDIEFGENVLISRLASTLNMTEAAARKLLYDVGFQRGDEPMNVTENGRHSREIAQTISEILRPEFAALLSEVNKTLIYTASKTRGSSVERAFVIGSVARYPHVSRLLQTLIAIPVDQFDPLAPFREGVNVSVYSTAEAHGGVAIATGLALRKVG
jgi:type IV pilus assembly protein PilM